MPVFAEGDGYDMVNEILFRVGYDTSQIQFIELLESALTNINVVDNNSVITASWSDPVSPVDLTIEDTLFFLDFVFIGDTNTSTEFLAGSFVFNNDTIVSTEFSGGYIIPRFPITLLNSPDTAGTALGEGIYFINDTVTITAIPEEGFYFSNWTYADTNVLSNDSLFSFQMDPIYDTITANYIPFSFDLSLIASPPEGGELIGEGTYPYGQTVMVYAVPSPGYYFMYWLFGNDTLSANPEYSFIMPNNNIELIGSFAPIEYNIVTNPNNPDYGTAEGGGHYYYGDTAEIVATPFAGYEFIAWTENGQVVSYDSAYSVIVYSDHEYIANFQAFSTCPAPVGLYGVGMDETSAMLFWTPAGSEEEWDLIWGETGFDTLTGGNLVEGLTDTELLLEGLDPGTMYDFYVRAVCDGSFYSNWSLPYTFVTWYVSIAEKSLDISIYPNPTIGKLFLISNINETENINYTVCDIYGKKYKEGVINTKQNMYIDLSEIPNGLYFLRLNAREYSNIVSVIKN